ncbi:hypothetical protein [Bordetella holmesii]|uniref:hypothetical protein n=1 Tax=Bordetella holmesii TaxID=35814 RepID=UPI0012985B04|nr:hypothetical protein [Bordetella holmesii]QGE29208.1 hypothetical protein FYA62_08170 [Bordetella holmesii]QGE39870.1 hypothetical protein FYA59_08170 [Bordetella holmesii]QGE43113.1 hypothetical protein FYA58_08165 [Bordetella holmesii]QGE46362.1 hypothetical protein FYA57_08170 [Bordetella holmesii]
MSNPAVSGVFLLLGSAVRWAGWLNGIACLLLMSFSLGIIGSEVAPGDLSWPLACFLAGMAATGLAFVLFACVRILVGGARLWLFWPVMLLALVCYGSSIAGFGAGCWLSLGGAVASSDDQYATT